MWATRHHEEYGDLVAQGVTDPAKVTRSAVENAASIAAMILTTEVLITDIPGPSAPAAPTPEYERNVCRSVP